MLMLALAACTPTTTLGNYCDASAVTVDGEPLGDLAVADGATSAGCFYFTAREVLEAQLYTRSLSDPASLFSVTVPRKEGPQVLYDGMGGVRVQTLGHDCIAYGMVRLVSDLPDWRVTLDDVECDDGTRVEGYMTGRFH